MENGNKKENRGGYRPGSGKKKAPPKEFSDEFKNKLLKALEKEGKKHNKNIYEAFAEKFYSKRIQDAVWSALFKQVMEAFVVKKSELEVTDRKKVVMLPPVKPIPLKLSDQEEEMTH